MKTEDKNEITHEGILKIGDFQIPCYVLKNGQRILSGRAMQSALKMVDAAEEGKQTSGARLARYLDQKSLKPFIYKNKTQVHFKPLICHKGESKINGFEATVLADICDGFLEARKHISLSPRQQIIADQCEMLIRSFAKVGIIALVDEATGYQNIREKDALQQFLQKFLAEEQGKWIKTFPDDFFESIFKMKGWTWTIANKGKKPQVVGHYINNYVYSRIAPKVLSELKRLNPKDENGNRKAKHPQLIDVNFGHPKLKEHLAVLTAFAKASGYNWSNWNRMVERALPKFKSDGSAAQELGFDDVE